MVWIPSYIPFYIYHLKTKILILFELSLIVKETCYFVLSLSKLSLLSFVLYWMRIVRFPNYFRFHIELFLWISYFLVIEVAFLLCCVVARFNFCSILRFSNYGWFYFYFFIWIFLFLFCDVCVCKWNG